MKRLWLCFLALLAVAPATAQNATPQTWDLTNPTGRIYQDELLRLKITPPAGEFTVQENDRAVPFQIEEIGGKKWVWVAASFGKGETLHYKITPGKAAAFAPKVSLQRERDAYVLDNGLIGIKVPASMAQLAGPVVQWKLPSGEWVGASQWHTALKLKKFSSQIVGDGTLFGKVRLRYEFDGLAGLDKNIPAFAQFDISLAPGQNHITIEESHAMNRGDYYEVELSRGWKPGESLARNHSGGFDIEHPFKQSGPVQVLSLKAGQSRLGETLLDLVPRWNQSSDDGWFFGAGDKTHMVGCLVARAGKWLWPHNNKIAGRLRESADYAGLRAPTWKGKRFWLLTIGPRALGDNLEPYVERIAFYPLDKLVHEYILDWPGKQGEFRGPFFYSGNINPTGAVRQQGKRALADAGKPGDYATLCRVQAMFDPDMYGNYQLFWSPQNPNFFTDFMRVPILETTRLKEHPNFKEFARRAEAVMREDIEHSVTLPGGAGQEAPGYLAHALETWRAMAPATREHLGFDPTTWPRFKAAEEFLFRLSQPDGEVRRFNPAGDTHPGPEGPKPIGIYGEGRDAKTLTSEELPGFGVVFRNRPGTPQETYLSFKSGPNRGHFHGDQLAFHWAANARPLMVDHYCSYKPRAGQEHMHNRVAFSTPELPFANMDGHERLIAFKTSPEVDVAMGQVESERLRGMEKLPPEKWHDIARLRPLEKTLTYRRTMVAMKNGAQDYFVIRDQYSGPEITATYCLHALSDKIERRGQTIDFGNATLFCAAPAQFAFEALPWSHNNGGKTESTQGARLTIKGSRGEFVTVLYPGATPPPMSAIAGGVKVGDDEIVFAGDISDEDGTNYVAVKRGGRELLLLSGRDIDLNRSQGDVGLFVPDAGYPFGEIPDWLICQRAGKAVP